MSRFADLPFQRKLGLAMLVTSTVALLAACTVFLTVEYYGYRSSIVHNLVTLAHISANNSTATIAFADPIGAQQNLEALRAEPQVIAATLYDLNGKVFAHYAQPSAQVLPFEPGAQSGTRLEKGFILVVQPVVEGNRRLGTLYLQGTMEQIYGRMRAYSLIVLGVLAASFGLAGLLAARLRRTLAQPILELASTAGAISTKQDYSLRARQYGRDELGQLTVAFNSMLEKTQSAVNGLKESEWAHRELVRALPVAAYMCDGTGVITLFNDAAVVLWGRTPEMGRERWSGTHRIYSADGTPMSIDETPMVVALREGKPVRGVEVIVERPDGSRRQVLSHAEPIRDSTGTLQGMVVMLVDVTEQKKGDVAVRQLAAIVESSEDAIVGKDLNGTVITWNRGAQRLFGYTAEQMIGQSILRLIPEEYQHEEPGILARIRQGERIEQYETVRRRQNGTLVNVALTVSPIRDASGKIVGASKIAHDITHRKRAEQQSNFISQLTQQLSALSNPDEIMQQAAQEVGRHLGVDRCYFSDLSEGGAIITVKNDWARHGFTSVSGIHHASDFGTPEMWQAMSSGPLAIEDKSAHPLTRNLGKGYDPLRIGAHATVPFSRETTWVASIAVTSEFPRKWRKDEMDLLENVIGRVWPMVERARSLDALRSSEKRQRELLRALPVPCYVVDRNGALVLYNQAAATLWGRTPELGVIYWQKIIELNTSTKTALAREQTAVAEALRKKEPVRGAETLVVRSDGSQRWIVNHPDPIFDAQGNCTGAVNVVIDVTEERTAHEKVQKVADRLNLAISAARLGDWNWDATTDIIAISPRTAEIFGVPLRPNLTRSGMRELLHEDDRERSQQALKTAIETRTDYDIEYRVRHADGTERWVAAKGRSFYGSNGQVGGMVGVVQDITERRQQAEILRQSEAQLRLVTDNAPVLLVRTDLAHRFTFVNRAYAERNGYTQAAMIGLKVAEALGASAYAAIRPYMEEAIGGARVEFEMEVPYGKIGNRWIHVIYVPEKDNRGAITGLLGVITDIGARKEAENALKRARDEAVAASRAKDDFLAALSHELRTPLNPVLLLASDAANNSKLPPAIRADFDLILKNVNLEARLIDDLLDLTRITRGKLHLEQRVCTLHSILEDALSTVEADIAAKKLQLTVDFAAPHSRIRGDSVRLQQVFWNILKNAVKFTPDGGQLSVITSQAGNGGLIRLQITDTGIGMTQEEISRVFLAFSQGDHASSGVGVHRFGGLGLGLAISKMLVDLHGGEISAFSEGRDRGSTFQVDLPLAVIGAGSETSHVKPDATPTHAPFSFVATNTPGGSPHRILLVEDHAPTRLMLQHLLKQRKFEVITAESAESALIRVKNGAFDLVISDVGLPDRSGYELMAELHELQPNLPGIALSGYGMEDDLARSRAAGFSTHLVKPVTIGMLEDAIATVAPFLAIKQNANPLPS